MGIRFHDTGFDRAEKRLENEGMGIMRSSSDVGVKVARDNAREDTSEMKNKTISVYTDDGARMEANAEHSNFNEFGTGREREGGGGRKTPWVYVHPRYGFVTTTGMEPKPFMRPGFDAGVDEFHRLKRQKGL